MDRGGTNAGHLARCHGDANPAAAHADPECCATGRNSSTHGSTEVGIVDSLSRVGSDVDNLVANPSEVLGHQILQRESCMVGADGDDGHGDPFEV